jgi:hypothetical protein
MKIEFLSISAILIFGGCATATTPTPQSEAKQVPKDRLLAFQEKKAETTSTLVVTRDTGFIGGGCYHGFSINGTLAARMDAGETSRFFVPPGEILLRVGRDPDGKGLCATFQDQWTQRETVLRENEMKYFRLTTDANGRGDIQRADE